MLCTWYLRSQHQHSSIDTMIHVDLGLPRYSWEIFNYTMKVQELSLHLIVAHGIMNQYSRLKHLNSQSLKRLHESPRAIIASYRSTWYHELVLQAQTLEQPKPQEILLCHFSLLHSVFTLHLTGRSLDIYMPLKSIKDWSQSQTLSQEKMFW